MKPNYTLTKLLTALAIVASCIICRAQNRVEYLNANNVKAGMTVGGNLFSDFDMPGEYTPLMEMPAGSGIKSLYTASLWITGTDAGNNLKCAAQMYRQNGRDFYDGPIASNYTAAYDSFFSNVFKVTQVQISLHKSKFQLLGASMTAADVDTTLLFWPAKGNPYAASAGADIQSRLAPFFDTDGDGQYDAMHGDYPLICGDQAIFFVYNDERGAHTESGGQPIGVEVRGLAEVYLDSTFGGFGGVPAAKRVINNTVFVKYEIENKSVNTLYDTRVAMYQDPDLGCYMNDFVGCDVARSMMFAYNGSSFDYDCQGISGYGDTKVAFGTKFLAGGFGSFNYFVNGQLPAYEKPNTPTGFRNYTLGRWNDGSSFTEDSLGYGGTTPTQYIYPGDPQNPAEWSDVTNGVLATGDRQMLGNSAAHTLPAGGTLVFDYAFIASMDNNATNLSIVDTLKMQSDEIQAFYDNNILPCRVQSGTTGLAQVSNPLQVSVYPNPASSVLMIEAPATINLVEVRDMLGRTVISQKTDTQKVLLNVSALAKGIYLLKVDGSGKTAVKKIVVE